MIEKYNKVYTDKAEFLQAVISNVQAQLSDGELSPKEALDVIGKGLFYSTMLDGTKKARINGNDITTVHDDGEEQTEE
jgi:hypothetical protein